MQSCYNLKSIITVDHINYLYNLQKISLLIPFHIPCLTNSPIHGCHLGFHFLCCLFGGHMDFTVMCVPTFLCVILPLNTIFNWNTNSKPDKVRYLVICRNFSVFRFFLLSWAGSAGKGLRRVRWCQITFILILSI